MTLCDFNDNLMDLETTTFSPMEHKVIRPTPDVNNALYPVLLKAVLLSTSICRRKNDCSLVYTHTGNQSMEYIACTVVNSTEPDDFMFLYVRCSNKHLSFL